MTMTRTAAALCACTMALAGGWTAGAGARAIDDHDVTLRGCLVKGEGDAGYLLTNAPGIPDWQRSADARIEPGAVGTGGGFESVFYWLDDDKDLRENVGHEVEVTGELKGDLKDGEIEIDRKDRWTEITVKSDGKKMKAAVPNPQLFGVSRDRGDQTTRVLVRKVDVDKVRMLAASCDGTR